MAKLEDFDKNKIVSFRYASIGNTSSIPQTFEDGHSGYVVTGTRDLIHEKFLESSGRVKAEATTFDPGAREVFTQDLGLIPKSKAFFAIKPAPTITLGFEVLVQLVIAAMTTDPLSSFSLDKSTELKSKLSLKFLLTCDNNNLS